MQWTGQVGQGAQPLAGRRALLVAGLASATLGSGPLAAAVAGKGADLAGVTLRVGTYKGNWRALLAAAQLPATPYSVDWRELNNGTLHIEAIAADTLDLGFGSEIPALFAARQQASVRFVALVREDLNNLVTVARGATPIRAVADLKGRRVGYARGTIAHYFLSSQLAEAGLTMSDIVSAHLAPADALQAFVRGDIDAWAIWGYNGQLARLQHGGRVVKTANGYASGNFPIFANPQALADARREAAIGDFLLRLRRAYLWANTHYLDFAKAQSAETRVAVGDLVELWNQRSTDYALLPASAQAAAAHQQVADVFLQAGVLDAPTRVAPFWDNRYAALLGRSA
jgi:sulfonate transport system substrate-binding protein